MFLEPGEQAASIGNGQHADGGSAGGHLGEPVEERLDPGPVHQTTAPPRMTRQARSVAGR